MSKERLSELVRRPGIVAVPGVADALQAKLVEAAGFPAVYMSGAMVSHSFGLPDVGLLTMTEMVERARSIVRAVKIPVIADADTGYGSAINVIRTVQEFESAGVAAVHLEDQILPKKSASMSGRKLVPIPLMQSRLRAAVYARQSRSFLIIARTDSLDTAGEAEAMSRARAFVEAGADIAFIQHPESAEQLRRFTAGIPAPVMITMGSWELLLPIEELNRLGIKICLFPTLMARWAIPAMRTALQKLQDNGIVPHNPETMVTGSEISELVGLPQVREWERAYPED